MKLLDDMKIFDDRHEEHRIELWHGDITKMNASDPVDFLVISAFPDDYIPTPSSVIGALNKKGVSVEQLSNNKLEDKRDSCNCWMSYPLTSISSKLGFRQILCYEPSKNIHPAESVGNIFRCLSSYAFHENSNASIATSLLSTGVAKVPIVEMLVPLMEAAANWMGHGLPIKLFKIIEHSKEKAIEMKGAFSMFKRYYKRTGIQTKYKYDIFISYCQRNKDDADYIFNKLRKKNGDIKIFMDRAEIEPGMAWQQKIFSSLINCRKIMLLYSPQYLASSACQEEYNIAQLFHLKKKDVMFPVYLYDADPLPHYMMFWQYRDCREGNKAKLRSACDVIIAAL